MGNCVSCIRDRFSDNADKPDEIALRFTAPHETVDVTKPRPPIVERSESEVARELPRPPATSSNPLLLQVQEVDLRIQENGKAHETWNYDWMEKGKNSRLIVRRGQVFDLTLKVSRPFDPKKDVLSLVFTITDANKPSPSRGTQVVLAIYDEPEEPTSEEWLAWIVKHKNTNVEIQVCTPADCIVGAWQVDVDSQRRDGNDAISYRLPAPIYILFNPWCKDDSVYLNDAEKLKEYICADSGLIWQGTATNLRQAAWNFAQFEENILDCALYVLHNIGRVPVPRRWDPIPIVRAISAAVNAQDDNGVLVGNWSGDFVGGTPPTGWNGSMRILQQFYRTKEPVKFAQCWVFAGVTTTICRALGIPSRVITNFNSAHDSECSMTIDVIVDDEGNPIKDLCRDSIWNFHVWNEVWMTRPDLGKDYDGWQVIDATPQERSSENKMFCCGPCSVNAIKKGEVNKPYDGEFIFAEVNADEVYWKYKDDLAKMKLLGQETDKIGRFISTKAVGQFQRNDVTNEYKSQDGTAEERAAVSRALRTAQNAMTRYYVSEAFDEVKFEIEMVESVVIGKPIKVSFTVVNRNTKESHDVSTTLSMHSVTYTGVPKALVKKESFEKTINPYSKVELGFTVPYEVYGPTLTDQGLLKLSLMGKVKNTDVESFHQADARVRKPDVRFNGKTVCDVNSNLVLEVILENPLPIPLTKPRFSVEGPGLGPAQKLKLPETIPVGGAARGSVTMVPRNTGDKVIAGSFWCNELGDVKGMFHVRVV